MRPVMRHNVGVITLQSPNGDVKTSVYPECGARIGSLSAFGDELLIAGNAHDDPLTWGCYPMVPYAGRVRGAILEFAGEQFPLQQNMPPHSIHGTVFDQTWRTLDVTSYSALLEIELGDNWPFIGRVQHHVQVTNHSLELQLTVFAVDPMPVQVGWHPWFIKPHATSLKFGAMYERDSSGIATSRRVAQPKTSVDDCLCDPEEPLTIDIGSVHVALASDCSHWVMYDLPSHATCIEPQSGPPNGVNDDPLILQANTSFTKKFTIEVQKIT